MQILVAALGALYVLSILQPSFSLTSEEVGWFESEEIPVIPGTDVIGNVTVDSFSNGTHVLKSNGIPDHAVAVFPNKRSPNKIEEQSFTMRFLQNPKFNDKPTCLQSNSIIGFATNGVAIFSPFDENSKNTNVGFGKTCQGSTSIDGIYYYAQVPNRCGTFTPGFRGHDPNRIYGVALDGFPIYGPGSGKTKVKNSDLDACHGKKVDGQYRYYMTDEWPYVLGCFRGVPVSVEGAPSTEGVCKFACNKRAKSNEIPCEDDFPTILTHGEL